MSTLGRMPVYGTRIALSEGDDVGWFFHCGEYSDAADFYRPLRTAHLSTYLPSVLPYLRLPAGARFMIDDAGYEDVWIAWRIGTRSNFFSCPEDAGQKRKRTARGPFSMQHQRRTKPAPQGNEIVKLADSGPTLITCE
ncbi:immunity protein Imm33 domain-containing protein [Burkholderia seminalis]|uniref:immunity protein Imm33 domain-containing protein n=1 Tax=Burkholderia seminalis TaxID=488731 RepID=UPI001453D79E|nr:hypothetical protein [Burkholderia seminalis]MCA8434302.1 hypothetical protein [Burkholderia seminalis]VWB26382.1 hypothetical protein BSE24067_01093 [Burkholderia seminalis]